MRMTRRFQSDDSGDALCSQKVLFCSITHSLFFLSNSFSLLLMPIAAIIGIKPFNEMNKNNVNTLKFCNLVNKVEWLIFSNKSCTRKGMLIVPNNKKMARKKARIQSNVLTRISTFEFLLSIKRYARRIPSVEAIPFMTRP